MIIYNVTINVDLSILSQWIQWMKNKHINDVLNTGLFTKARLVKVLVEEEMGGETYAVQFFAETRTNLDEYYKKHAPKLRLESSQLFGDKMLAFRTELEVIEDFYHSEN